MYQQSGPSEAVRHGGGRRTKNLQREREKRKRREERNRKEEKEKRGEKGKKGREEQEMYVKHPLRLVKRL